MCAIVSCLTLSFPSLSSLPFFLFPIFLTLFTFLLSPSFLSPSSPFPFPFSSHFSAFPYPLSHPPFTLPSFPHYCFFCCGVISSLSVSYKAKRNVNHSRENMVDLFATECPANCRSCEDTESGTRCKVDGCDEGYTYNADDGTCQR